MELFGNAEGGYSTGSRQMFIHNFSSSSHRTLNVVQTWGHLSSYLLTGNLSPWWFCANVSKISPLPKWLWTNGLVWATHALSLCAPWLWEVLPISLPQLFMLLMRTGVQQGRTCYYLKWGFKWPTLTHGLQTGPALWDLTVCRSNGQESINEALIRGKLPSGETVWDNTESNKCLCSSQRQGKGDVYQPWAAAWHSLCPEGKHTCPWVIHSPGCKDGVIFCDTKFKARLRPGCCATCLPESNLKIAHWHRIW